MQTVVELPEYQRRAAALLSIEEKASVINYLAVHPASGVVMQGTGGVRKLRWAASGKGKRGGVRIIYYYHSKEVPLFLLSVFGKSEKANLSRAERNSLAKLTSLLLKSFRG